MKSLADEIVEAHAALDVTMPLHRPVESNQALRQPVDALHFVRDLIVFLLERLFEHGHARNESGGVGVARGRRL